MHFLKDEGYMFYFAIGSSPISTCITLLCRRFLVCHATPSPPPPRQRKEKWLLKTEQHSFHEIRQSQARLHFQEPVSAKFPRWNFPNYKMPFIYVFHHRRPATPQNEHVVSGLCLWTPQKILATLEWILFIAVGFNLKNHCGEGIYLY